MSHGNSFLWRCKLLSLKLEIHLDVHLFCLVRGVWFVLTIMLPHCPLPKVTFVTKLKLAHMKPTHECFNMLCACWAFVCGGGYIRATLCFYIAPPPPKVTFVTKLTVAHMKPTHQKLAHTKPMHECFNMLCACWAFVCGGGYVRATFWKFSWEGVVCVCGGGVCVSQLQLGHLSQVLYVINEAH